MGIKKVLGKATTVYLIIFLPLFVAVCFWGILRFNLVSHGDSMVGKPVAEVIASYGPPTRRIPSGQGVEVLEWEIHLPGRMSMAGKIPITTPPKDEIRRATIHGGVCIDESTWTKQ
jgi:hypothetical protein